MGTLDGMTNLSTSRNLELLPTVTAIQVGRLNAAGEFETDTVKEAGGNLKYGVTSNLTFDFTYNPDFSQIESDRQQIEINQRFPVLYPELRPFFLEGQEIFRIAGPHHLYPYADDRRSALRREAVRENRQDHARAARRQRRSAGTRRQSAGSRIRPHRPVRRRPRPLRSVPRVDRERHLHQPRVHESAQPRDWRRRRFCDRTDASIFRARHCDRPSRRGRRAAQRVLLRFQSAESGSQRQLLAHQQRDQPGSAHRRRLRAPHRPAAVARQYCVSVVAGALADQLGAQAEPHAELSVRRHAAGRSRAD